MKNKTAKYEPVGWANLHNHKEFSLFDGFGKMKHAAQYAKEIGQTAMGLSDHGTVSGLIEHYQACKEQGIKPIMGCEIYFKYKFDPTNDEHKKEKYFHMCLFCKDLEGYQNLMRIITEASRETFYRVPIVTYKTIKKYRKGLICTTACLAGWPSKAIMQGKTKQALNRIKKLKSLFGEDLYIELMPYHVYEDVDGITVDLQYEVDMKLIELSEQTGVKCIITTDSHFIRKEDFETFKLMFQIGKKNLDIDYSQRYMPTERDVAKRFRKMYKKNPKQYLLNTKEVVDKCNCELQFEEGIPKIEWPMESKKYLKKLVKDGLKKKDRYDKKHWEQCLYEFDTIFDLGFEDYFLLCWDIVKFALDNNIGYGKGRGSVCGSLVAYALNLTEVDPLELGTKFERFLRKDKKKMPDIDMDFCSIRRQEVIDYICKRYGGRAIQVATYGYYKSSNLTNDLGKVLEMEKDEIKEAKKILNLMYPELVHGTDVDYYNIISNEFMKDLEKRYHFVTHFSKLCGQIRYIGKHAGGVAITVGEATEQFAIIKSSGSFQACYDLMNLEYLKVLKMDILGLSTVTILKELEQQTGVEFSDMMYKDKKIIKDFRKVNTTGIFQFDKQGAKAVLQEIKPDTLQDVIAATAINRPAPLSLGMTEIYADAKHGHSTNSLSSKYLPDTYGCLIYQEDIITLGKELSDLPWESIDKIMKGLKEASGASKMAKAKLVGIKKEFVREALKKHPDLKEQKYELSELFELMTGGYLFNKGHAAGYILLSVEQMYFKHYYPLEFWATTLKHEGDDMRLKAYEVEAAKQGIVLLPAHINGPADYKVVEYGGGKCIQRGLSKLKGVGPKAAAEIESNAPYFDRPDFDERTTKRICNARVTRVLEENNAFEFNDKKIRKSIIKLNSSLVNSNLTIRR